MQNIASPYISNPLTLLSFNHMTKDLHESLKNNLKLLLELYCNTTVGLSSNDIFLFIKLVDTKYVLSRITVTLSKQISQ